MKLKKRRVVVRLVAGEEAFEEFFYYRKYERNLEYKFLDFIQDFATELKHFVQYVLDQGDKFAVGEGHVNLMIEPKEWFTKSGIELIKEICDEFGFTLK